MICNRTETGWEVIFQRAHGLLAAALLRPWKTEERPARWTETLSATAQHDNGWQEWEPGERLTPIGTPRDFTETPIEDLVAQSERALVRAWHQSLWCGLLVSRHITRLYEPLRGEADAMDALLDAQTDQRRAWRDALGVKQQAVDDAYALLHWADTFSLILCQRQLPNDARAIEIGDGPDGTRYDVAEQSGGALVVTPWPYAVDAFDIRVESYRLDQLTFEDDDALAQALRKAGMQVRTWTLRAG